MAIAADLESDGVSSVADRVQSNPSARETLQGFFQEDIEDMSSAALSVREDVPQIATQIDEAVSFLNQDIIRGSGSFKRTFDIPSLNLGSRELFGEINGILRLNGVIEAFGSGDERVRLITALILYKKTEEFLETLMQSLESDIRVISISIGASERDLAGKKQRLAELTTLPEEERSDELQREMDLLKQDIQRLEGEGTQGDKNRSSGILPRAKARRQSRQKALDFVEGQADLWEHIVTCSGKKEGGQYSATEIAYLASSCAFDIREMIDAKLKPYIEKFKLSEKYAGLNEDNIQAAIINRFVRRMRILALQSSVAHEAAAITAGSRISRMTRRNELTLILALALGASAAATLIPHKTTDDGTKNGAIGRKADKDTRSLSPEVFQQKVVEALSKEPIQMDSWLTKGQDGVVSVATSPRINKSILDMGADVDEVKIMSFTRTQNRSTVHGSLKNIPTVVGSVSQKPSVELDALFQYWARIALLKLDSYQVVVTQPGLGSNEVGIDKELEAMVMNEGPDVQLFRDAFLEGEITDEDAANPDKVLDVILPRLLGKDPVKIHLKWVEGFYPPQLYNFEVAIPDGWNDSRFIQGFKVSLKTPSGEVVVAEVKRDSSTGKFIPLQKPEMKSNTWRRGTIPTITIETPLGTRVYQDSGLKVTDEWVKHSVVHPDHSTK